MVEVLGKDTGRLLGVWAFFEAAKVSKWYLKVDVPRVVGGF